MEKRDKISFRKAYELAGITPEQGKGRDLVTLNTHNDISKINKWSKCKPNPVRGQAGEMAKLDPDNEEDMKVLRQSGGGDSPERYGVMMYVKHLGGDSFASFDFEYRKPGYNTTCRVLDWLNYHPTVSPWPELITLNWSIGRDFTSSKEVIANKRGLRLQFNFNGSVWGVSSDTANSQSDIEERMQYGMNILESDFGDTWKLQSNLYPVVIIGIDHEFYMHALYKDGMAMPLKLDDAHRGNQTYYIPLDFDRERTVSNMPDTSTLREWIYYNFEPCTADAPEAMSRISALHSFFSGNSTRVISFGLVEDTANPSELHHVECPMLNGEGLISPIDWKTRWIPLHLLSEQGKTNPFSIGPDKPYYFLPVDGHSYGYIKLHFDDQSPTQGLVLKSASINSDRSEITLSFRRDNENGNDSVTRLVEISFSQNAQWTNGSNSVRQILSVIPGSDAGNDNEVIMKVSRKDSNNTENWQNGAGREVLTVHWQSYNSSAINSGIYAYDEIEL